MSPPSPPRAPAAERFAATTGRHRDRGMVTAEIALAMPAVILLIAAVISSGQLVLAQVNCLDAARAGARLAIRGDAGGAIRAATAIAPSGAVVAVSGHDHVHVRVSAAVAVPLPGSTRLAVSCTADGWRESGLP